MPPTLPVRFGPVALDAGDAFLQAFIAQDDVANSDEYVHLFLCMTALIAAEFPAPPPQRHGLLRKVWWR